MFGKETLYPHNQGVHIARDKKRFELPAYFTLFLLVLPIFAGMFAGWAVLNLPLEITAGVIAKAVLIGAVVAIVSYAINRFAIDWGTELAAGGYWLAGSFSLASMLGVGACLWFFSFGGIVLPDVRVLRFEDHGIALSQNLQLRQEQANKAMRIVPVIAAARDDLAFHAACERANGCLSLRGGGTGTLSRVLDERSARAGNIAEQLDAGAQEFDAIIAEANEILGAYQSVLNDDAISLKEKRQALIGLDGRFVQTIIGLEETIPVPLIAAYAKELLEGVTIPGRPDATRAVNTLLKKHGVAINAVLGTIERDVVDRTQFPGKAGLSDTLQYVGNFAPLAGVIWVAEGIFPLALWIYTLLFLIRQRDRNEANTNPDPDSPSSDGRTPSSPEASLLLNATAETANTNSKKRRRRRRKGKSDHVAKHLNGRGSVDESYEPPSQTLNKETE